MDEGTAQASGRREATSHTSPGAVVCPVTTCTEHGLTEGQRVGRFIILRDVDGRLHAVAAGAVAALGETDDFALVLLPGGRMIHVPHPMDRVLRWLSG